MKIAVFDVCDTLYSVNTTFSFLDDYFKDNKRYQIFRKISRLFVVKVANYFVYKYTKKDLIRLYATGFLKGKSVQEIETHAHKFVYGFLSTQIQKNIVDMLMQYKKEGYSIVLMSGSYEFIIKEVANYVKAEYFYASKLQVANGVYLGKYDEDILLSKDKLLKKQFPNIDKLIVVSDNKTDLPLMQVADSAFAVCNKEKDCAFWEKYSNISILKEF
jgi:HAD superfamily phosphoserine phosphatase-like hydrolase